MLRSLVDLLIAFIELLEAEADELLRHAKRLGVQAAILAVAACVAVLMLAVGTGFLIWALYLALAALLGGALAALLCGLVLWGTVGVAAAVALRRTAR